jgi:hypothetical protein
MSIIHGQIIPPVSATAIAEGWRNRYGNEIAPQADLQTEDGSTFAIVYSPTWSLESLKHSFQLEVHRLGPTSEVVWA